MTETPVLIRTFLVIVLVGILFGLCVWYGSLAPAPALGLYTAGEESSQSAVGGESSISMSGSVVSTDPVIIEVISTQRTRFFTITNVSTSVSKGDTLRVFGEKVDRDTVHATRVLVVHPYGYLYAYTASVLAGLWVAVRLWTYWQLDRTRGVVRRTSPTSLLSRFRRWLGHTEREVKDSDA